MNPKLTQKLLTDFPDLFTPDVTYFDCADGWFQLIYDLSKDISDHIKSLPPTKEKSFQVVQVKNKYGGLRYYMDGSDVTIQRLVHAAEVKAHKTCETCGNTGFYEQQTQGVVCYDHSRTGINRVLNDL